MGWGESVRQPREPGAIVFAISDTVDRADIPAHCERLRVLLENNVSHAVLCDVGRLRQVDVTTVDALARFHLIARRSGRSFQVRHVSAELADLLALIGLSEVVSLESPLSLPAQGQIEEREELCGIEEEADPGDSTV